MTICWRLKLFETCPIADALAMCFTSAMGRSKNLVAAAAPFAISFLSGCTSPISDPATLRTMESEARSLIIEYPVSPPNGWADIPMRKWPPKMASLKPDAVTVHRWGVDIMVKSGIDGGYGYAVPKNQEDLPMPAKCYSELRQGVFWHSPC